jgi:glucose-6-phosphate 1-dehydrogenase
MKIIEPCTLVIFGAAGNLSRRKLIPALFSLEKVGRLPRKRFACNVEQRRREEWSPRCNILHPLYPQGIDQPALNVFARVVHHASLWR